MEQLGLILSGWVALSGFLAGMWWYERRHKVGKKADKKGAIPDIADLAEAAIMPEKGGSLNTDKNEDTPLVVATFYDGRAVKIMPQGAEGTKKRGKRKR